MSADVGEALDVVDVVVGALGDDQERRVAELLAQPLDGGYTLW